MGRHDESIREITKRKSLTLFRSSSPSMSAWNITTREIWSRRRLRCARHSNSDPISPTHIGCWPAPYFCREGVWKRSRKPARRSGSRTMPLRSPPRWAKSCAMGGQPEEARKILAELAARSTVEHVSPIHFARLYAGLDEKDRMFESLEESFQEREFLLLQMLNDPLLAPLRSDPRFADLEPASACRNRKLTDKWQDLSRTQAPTESRKSGSPNLESRTHAKHDLFRAAMESFEAKLSSAAAKPIRGTRTA